jgi:hypothetical protein
MAKSLRQKIVDKLDNITRQIIKKRDKNICQRCGKFADGQGCHWAHIYGRRSFILRWDLLNSLVLCAGCHRWWHENPLESENWFRDKFIARHQYLQNLRQKTTKTIKTSALQDLLEVHRKKLKEL